MTHPNLATADEWRHHLDTLGPVADLHEYQALLNAVPADLPTDEREYLAGYMAGLSQRPATAVEQAYKSLRPHLDELDNESAWTRRKTRELRQMVKGFAAISPVSVGDKAIRRQVAEELGYVGGFTDLVSLLLC